MKKMLIPFLLVLSLLTQAQKEKAEAYISAYKEVAILEMMRSGVPASIKLAQGILESQSGESVLALKSNNHFGIKCKTEWTGPTTYHDDDEKGECFRVYENVEQSYKDHSDFLKTRPHYAFLFTLDPTDFDGWAKGLKKAGYATSNTYPQKLLKVINDYQLQQYTLQALARQKNDPLPDINTFTTSIETSSVKKEVNPSIQGISENNAMQFPSKEISEIPPLSIKKTEKTTVYPDGIFIINQSKVVYEKVGKSVLSLANQYDLSLSKLLEYNDIAEMDVLDTDRLIFLEKKLKKGAREFHIVAIGENLHDISQAEGIRYESILEYNHLKKGAAIAVGEKLWLHAPSASISKPVK